MASEPRSRLELIPGSDGPRDISALQLATLAIFGERVGRHSGQVPRPRLLDYLEEELEGPRPDNLDSVKFKPVNALQRSMTVWLVQLHPARLFNLGRDLSRLAGDTEVTRDLADQATVTIMERIPPFEAIPPLRMLSDRALAETGLILDQGNGGAGRT